MNRRTAVFFLSVLVVVAGVPAFVKAEKKGLADALILAALILNVLGALIGLSIMLRIATTGFAPSLVSLDVAIVLASVGIILQIFG